MGHGNGWPSRYRDSLHGTTQNGFGLNPEAGGSDDRHQYFGESVIARQVKLAKDAVVLLNHLCYASGTASRACQRATSTPPASGPTTSRPASSRLVHRPSWPRRTPPRTTCSAPSWAVARSVAATWRSAPSANGNVIAFESSRSRGYIGQLDPERAASGFERSIVVRSGLVPDDVRAGRAVRPLR